MNDKFYSRKLFRQIKPFIDTHDIIVIHGARQTGKTTLLKMLIQTLPSDDVYYFDLEDNRLLDVCNDGPDPVVQYLRQKGALKEQQKFYLIIDEIQYLSNPSSFLKLLHDHYDYLKLIVSGSSSFAIKSKFKDSLVGRTVNFELYPLDFEEFLSFKNQTFNLKEKITSKLLINELKKLYTEYVLFGGYPKIVLADSINFKETYLQQIIDTYIKSDIRDLAQIRDISKFNKLLYILASQSGQLLNVTELANTTQLARQTIDEYLFILENTYIIKLVTPFSQNIRSELFKKPKIFFYDTGILTMLRFKMLAKELTGSVFETSIFSELIKNFNDDSIYFWRTHDKKEIDFIISKQNNMLPIEVKLNAHSLKFTALKYFHTAYSPPQSFCVSLDGDLKTEKFPITNIKPWEILPYISSSKLN